MGREFVFYPGVKKDGKYNCLYWKKKGDKLKPADVYWSSGSFIDGQWFLDVGKQIRPTELHEDIVDEFAWSFDENATLEEKECYLYEIPMSAFKSAKPMRGLIEGYVPLDELKVFGACEDVYDQQEYIAWEMSSPLPASVVLEMPDEERKKYGKLSFVDTYSAGYVCNVLSEVMSSVFDNDACVLMLYSF